MAQQSPLNALMSSLPGMAMQLYQTQVQAEQKAEDREYQEKQNALQRLFEERLSDKKMEHEEDLQDAEAIAAMERVKAQIDASKLTDEQKKEIKLNIKSAQLDIKAKEYDSEMVKTPENIKEVFPDVSNEITRGELRQLRSHPSYVEAYGKEASVLEQKQEQISKINEIENKIRQEVDAEWLEIDDKEFVTKHEFKPREKGEEEGGTWGGIFTDLRNMADVLTLGAVRSYRDIDTSPITNILTNMESYENKYLDESGIEDPAVRNMVRDNLGNYIKGVLGRELYQYSQDLDDHSASLLKNKLRKEGVDIMEWMDMYSNSFGGLPPQQQQQQQQRR